jgi:NADPH2:quinone reductase
VRGDSAVPVAWRVHREVVGLAGWGSAILAQLAHPAVARAVADHSGFREGWAAPWRRLARTLDAMLALTFGPDEEAERAARRINAVHDRVHGDLPPDERTLTSRSAYSAHDPTLLAWVHLTCVDAFVRAHELFVAPLTREERDRYCAEAVAIEPRLGIPAGTLPRAWAGVQAALAARVASGEIVVGAVARSLAPDILRPPGLRLADPLLAPMRLATAGLLPPAIREGYGLAWTARHARALGLLARTVRIGLRVTPAPLRHWPRARAAARRRGAIIRPHAATEHDEHPARRSPSMKAIRIHAPGGPESLRYEDVPDPTPKAGEAVIKVDAAGLNYIDVYYRTGLYKAEVPLTLGLEAGGTVTTVGPNVTDVKVGDKVAYTGVAGAYAQYAVVPAARLVVLPAGVSTRQGAAAMLQGMTAHYLASSTYPLKKGDACLVHAAAGGVGLLLCQIAKMRGARVIGTVSTDDKAKLAREAGADEVILYTTQDFEAEAKRITAGKGLQVVYDSVGKTTFDKGFNVLAPRGMMVLYGQSSGTVAPFDVGILAARGSLFLTRPSLFAYTATREELVQRAGDVLGWIRDGKLRLRMEFEFPLRDVAQAHRALEGRKTTGKVLLIP